MATLGKDFSEKRGCYSKNLRDWSTKYDVLLCNEYVVLFTVPECIGEIISCNVTGWIKVKRWDFLLNMVLPRQLHFWRLWILLT